MHVWIDISRLASFVTVTTIVVVIAQAALWAAGLHVLVKPPKRR